MPTGNFLLAQMEVQAMPHALSFQSPMEKEEVMGPIEFTSRCIAMKGRFLSARDVRLSMTCLNLVVVKRIHPQCSCSQF